MFATKTNATGSNATKNPNHVKKERAESLHVWLGGLHAPLVRGQPTHRPQSLSFHRSQTEVSTAPGHRFSPKRFSIRRPGSERLVPALRRLPEPSLSFPSSLPLCSHRENEGRSLQDLSYQGTELIHEDAWGIMIPSS